MHSLKRQQGVTALGWLIILGLIGFFAFIGLKLFPIYVENFSVARLLKSLSNEPGLARKSRNEIYRMLQKKFDINDVQNVSKNNVNVNKRNGIVYISIEYSVVQPLFAELSLVADFNESIEVAN